MASRTDRFPLPVLAQAAMVAAGGALLLTGCTTDQQAATNARPALRTTDEDTGALLRVAAMTRKSGDFDTAAALYRRAHELTPKDPRPLIELADMLDDHGAPADAALLWQDAARLAPNNARVLSGYGITLARLGQAQLAQSYLQKAAKAAPSATTWNALGVVRDRLGDAAGAQKAYRAGLALAPTDLRLTNNLGLSLALSGQYDEALTLLERIVVRPDATARNRQNLALAYALAGKDKLATKFSSVDSDPADAKRSVMRYASIAALPDHASRVAAVVALDRPRTKRQPANASAEVANLVRSRHEAEAEAAATRPADEEHNRITPVVTAARLAPMQLPTAAEKQPTRPASVATTAAVAPLKPARSERPAAMPKAAVASTQPTTAEKPAPAEPVARAVAAKASEAAKTETAKTEIAKTAATTTGTAPAAEAVAATETAPTPETAAERTPEPAPAMAAAPSDDAGHDHERMIQAASVGDPEGHLIDPGDTGASKEATSPKAVTAAASSDVMPHTQPDVVAASEPAPAEATTTAMPRASDDVAAVSQAAPADAPSADQPVAVAEAADNAVAGGDDAAAPSVADLMMNSVAETPASAATPANKTAADEPTGATTTDTAMSDDTAAPTAAASTEPQLAKAEPTPVAAPTAVASTDSKAPAPASSDTVAADAADAPALPLALTGVMVPSVDDRLTVAATAYNAGEYALAASIWQPLADAGVVRAQFHLGALYYEGRGVERDLKKAYTLLRRAELAGFADARIVLALVEAKLPEAERLSAEAQVAAARP